VGRGAGARGLTVRPFTAADLTWAEPLVAAEMGGRWQVRRGERVDALRRPGWVAEREAAPAGLLTAAPRADGWELVLLLAIERRTGVARTLVEHLVDEARRAGAGQLWVVTTNDNLAALGFYQRVGFRLSALRAGAVDEARATMKPDLPTTGLDGLPIRDELELHLPL
jgi:GNAT superfamily N-acetyltransferase